MPEVCPGGGRRGCSNIIDRRVTIRSRFTTTGIQRMLHWKLKDFSSCNGELTQRTRISPAYLMSETSNFLRESFFLTSSVQNILILEHFARQRYLLYSSNSVTSLFFVIVERCLHDRPLAREIRRELRRF